MSPTWPRSSARAEAAQASTAAACSSSSSRATSVPICTRCLPTCGETPAASPASVPMRRQSRTCASADARAGREYQFVMQSLDRPQLYEWSQKMADAMSRDPHFADVNSDLQINATQATLIVDKDKASLARHLGGATALDALFRLRQPADLDHLRHRRQLLRGDGVQRQGQLDHRRAAGRAHSQCFGQAGTDRRVRPRRAHSRVAHHQPAGPASRGHDLVQPAAWSRAGRCDRSGSRS